MHTGPDVQVTDGSLIPGHHQDCPVDDAHGGWLFHYEMSY
jgi:hypothetical protein